MSRRSSAGGILQWLARGAIFLIFLAIAGAVYIFELGSTPTATSDPEPAPPTVGNGRTAISSGLIKAYFTTPTLAYPDRRDKRSVSPLLDAVIEDVNEASRTIDIAVFDIDLSALADALIAAQQRGVQVRLVVDSENLATPEVSEVCGRMQKAGIPITFDDREAFMHNKFIIVDRRIVWLGSWNMTENDTYRNNNNMLRVRSQLAANGFQQEFESMFAGIFGPRKPINQRPNISLDETPIDVYFSPEDGAAKYVLAEIKRAKKSIRFMAFSFTATDIADAIIARHAAGIDVQGVMERQNAAGLGAVFDQLTNAGVSVIEDGNCYILHHKVLIIDNRIVITGSYNFTKSAERNNDETLLIIADPELAEQYRAEWARVNKQAQSPVRCG